MGDIVAERARYGNGHVAWLNSQSPPWPFIRDMGVASDKVGAGSQDVVSAFVRHQGRGLAVAKNKQVCLDLKGHFKSTGELPTDMSVSCWRWYTRQMLMVYAATRVLVGRDVSEKEANRLVALGALVANVAYVNYNVWDNGSQTFVVSRELASKLMLTDVGHVKMKDLRLPFPAFVLQVPPIFGMLLNDATGAHDVDSVMVVAGTSGDLGGKPKIELLFSGMENENSSDLGDDAVAYANLWCDDPEKTLHDVIHKEGSCLVETEGFARFAGTSRKDSFRNLLMWACAMILYITDFPADAIKKVDPDIEGLKKKIPTLKGKSKKNAKRKLRALQSANAPYHVGTTVKIDPRLEKAAAQAGRGKRSSPSVATYVRGHRKMQAYGPQRTERKPIWVDPYWRNLENEQTSTKTYDVR